MAGISSGLGTVAIAKQTAKGTPAGTPVVRYNLAAAPSLLPERTMARYTSTGQGRNEGNAYTTLLAVQGEFSFYLHHDGFALPAYLALGAIADAGAGPDYTHTITPADVLPYFTLWRMVGNNIFERWDDCKCTMLRVESSAGGPAMATMGVIGVKSTFLASDPVLAALTSDGLLHYEAADQFKFATVAQRLSRFTVEITNNASGFQADHVYFDDVDEGKLLVAASFATRYQGPTSFPKYRRHIYGSDAGTDMVSTVTTEAVAVDYVRAANKGVKFDLPQTKYVSIPVQPDPSGDPIGVEVSLEIEKPSGSPIVTVTVKDQTATW